MLKYRGVRAVYLGQQRWRIIFSEDCSMDRICRKGIDEVMHIIDYHLDYKDIWGLW